jgi:TPR repeat protein
MIRPSSRSHRGIPAAVRMSKAVGEHSRSDQPAEERLREANGLLKEGRYDEAVRILKPLADAAMPQAQLLLGLTFEAGRGHRKDDVSARRWYEMAAEQRYAPAEFYLGSLQARRGERDSARVMFERAAAQAFLPALYRLALLGLGRCRESEAAIAYLREAANRGDIPSSIKLERLALERSSSLAERAHSLVALLKFAFEVVRLGTRSPHDERLLR